MRFSVFTPTHRPEYLSEAFDSLLAQSHSDWEWVLIPNGGAFIPDRIRAHARVRIIPAPDWVSQISPWTDLFLGGEPGKSAARDVTVEASM